MAFHALIIDADAGQRQLMRNTLCSYEWQVWQANSGESAMRIIDEHPWKIVFCDFDSGGLSVLRALKKRLGSSVHVIMTAQGGGRSRLALEAILNGASDYLRKPFDELDVREHAYIVLERLRAAARETRTGPLAAPPGAADSVPAEYELIGESEAITYTLKELAKSLRGDCEGEAGGTDWQPPTYLITGETGTGKELVARMIHHNSRYRDGQFVPINCSNLSAELADAELFGSSPGAYTGALREEQPGLWEIASKGTLFLDEITEAGAAVLPKLLRVLQDGKVKRLGAKRWIRVDAQVIAASNRDVVKEIGAGRFREDLYHRLSLHKIHLPPLRDRQEDVPLLAAHFAKLHSPHRAGLSRDAVRLLMKFSSGYEWPGNIRELENVIRKAVKQSPDGTVYGVDLIAHLPRRDQGEPPCAAQCQAPAAISDHKTENCVDGAAGEGLRQRVRWFKYRVVEETLAACGGNRTRAASALGITRKSLYKLLRDSARQDTPSG